MSIHTDQWKINVNLKPKLHIYANIKQSYKRENYCHVNMKRSQRALIAKLRLGILPIRVETGRYNSIKREERLCLVCNNGDVEDEQHDMFYCKVHSEIRLCLLDKARETEPNFINFNDVEKLHFLSTNKNIVRKTAMYIHEMLNKRQKILNMI